MTFMRQAKRARAYTFLKDETTVPSPLPPLPFPHITMRSGRNRWRLESWGVRAPPAHLVIVQPRVCTEA